MKRVLISGDTSYIGKSFEKYIQQFHSSDYLIDSVSLRNSDWKKIDFSGYDTAFHVAGIAHVEAKKISDAEKKRYYSINTDLAYETARKAKEDGVAQFIFMSSLIIFGDPAPIGKTRVIKADTAPDPSTVYGDSKLQAEIKISTLSDDSFHVVIIRSPMVYGHGCKGNYPRLVKLAKKLPVIPRINNQRSMIYIGNLVEFIRLMIKNEESGIFYPTNEEYTNTSEMMLMIARLKKKHVRSISGVEWLLRLFSHFTPIINKAYGSIVYSEELSQYKENYRLYSLEQSILMIEEQDNG